MVVPLFSTFYYSFTDKTTYSESGSEEFVGLDNFYHAERREFTLTPVVDEDGNVDPTRVLITGSTSPREIRTDWYGNEYILRPFDETQYFINERPDGSIYAVSILETGVFGTVLYRQAFINTPLLWIMGFAPQFGLALLLAAWFTDIQMNIRGKGLFKVIFYMPNIMTAATISALFIAMTANGGIIHQIALSMGIIENSATPITGLWYTRSIIAFINFWLWFGNTMIVLIASMMSINQGIFEAARIDGANKLQIFFKITIPSIKPVFIFTLIQSLVGGLQMFDVPSLLSGGVGTSFHPQGTRTIMTSIQTVAFGADSNAMGIAAAMSVILFLITAVCSITIFAMTRNRDDRRETKLMRIHLKDEKERFKLKQQGGGTA
jgi:multiple sugar transport system permease protein